MVQWLRLCPSSAGVSGSIPGLGTKSHMLCGAAKIGLPCSSVGKESAFSAGDLGSISGLGRSPGEGNGNPLQYPCLENLMDRGA